MKLSIVTTLYYSESYVIEFYRRLKSSIPREFSEYEIIFVDDGSPDSSIIEVKKLLLEDNSITLIELTRNYGHHKAIMAGLAHVTGDYIFLIDSDLEEEPELLTPFWECLKKNDDIDVCFGKQKKRKGNFSERIFGSVFYKLIDFIGDFNYPSDTTTARLMTKRYVETVNNYPERSLDVWGVFSMVGYKQDFIEITKHYKGSTTYSFSRKFKMAIEIITSISSKPLISIFFLGLFIFVGSLFFIAFIFVNYILYDMSSVIGWSSLIASVWLMGGLIILILGIISIYLSKMFIEVKSRPLFSIKSIHKIGNVNGKVKYN